MMVQFNLERFSDAQASSYDAAVRELQAGRKQTHWMWFIFPQIRGLGSSAMATRYAITSLGEAKAYASHRTLGTRLEYCTQLVNDIEGRSIEDIFGWPDHLKFHSSMTLFVLATAAPLFQGAIAKFFGSELDRRTLELARS